MIKLLIKLTAEQTAFLAKVGLAMQAYFAHDQRRIDHALQVYRYAEELLTYIDADPLLVLTAAYLHDIGIPEAERKHNSCAGNLQELEGPPVARALLADLAADPSLTETVAEIVGHHHTSRALDSPEFRIIWDADALVNFAEVLPSKSSLQVEGLLKKHMVTEAGFQMARRLFLQAGQSQQ